MKIVVLDGLCAKQQDLSYDFLNKFGEVTVYDRTPKELTVSRIGDAEIILTNKTVIGRDVIEACPGLKLISVLATGFNIIDLVAAKEKGIIVSNVPGYSTDSVVQHTFAMLLNVMNKVGRHNHAVKDGEWERNEDFCFLKAPIYELAGKTFGIIGYGSIGKKVGKVAEAFGMKVIYNKRHQDENTVSLDEIYEKSDVISLHCPQTAENAGFINDEAINKMKKGVIIINTARGGIVNEDAVIRGLESGKIGYYLADVLSKEPTVGNKLQYEKNAVITPHIAWATFEARERLLNSTEENIKAFIDGNPQNVVNK